MFWKSKVATLGEVTLVLALFFYFRVLFKQNNFGDWQNLMFGDALVSSGLLLFVLPLMFVLIRRGKPGSIGLTGIDMKYERKMSAKALGFLLPATILFPVLGILGLTPMDWMGASILTGGFSLAGWLFIVSSKDLNSRTESMLPKTGTLYYIAMLVFGLLLSALIHPHAPLLSNIIRLIIFVGFLEEFFFRGYVQSRLNDCFGKTFNIAKVDFGWGLISTSLIFGLLHPLTVANETPWPWALSPTRKRCGPTVSTTSSPSRSWPAPIPPW